MSNRTTALLILVSALLQTNAFGMDKMTALKAGNAPKVTLIQPGKYFYYQNRIPLFEETAAFSQNRIPEQPTTPLTIITVKKTCQAFVPSAE